MVVLKRMPVKRTPTTSKLSAPTKKVSSPSASKTRKIGGKTVTVIKTPSRPKQPTIKPVSGKTSKGTSGGQAKVVPVPKVKKPITTPQKPSKQIVNINIKNPSSGKTTVIVRNTPELPKMVKVTVPKASTKPSTPKPKTTPRRTATPKPRKPKIWDVVGRAMKGVPKGVRGIVRHIRKVLVTPIRPLPTLSVAGRPVRARATRRKAVTATAKRTATRKKKRRKR